MIQFVDQGSVVQIFVGILFAVFWGLIESLCEPYLSTSINNRISKWSLFSIASLLALAGLLQSIELEGGDHTTLAALVDVLFILAIFLPVSPV